MNINGFIAFGAGLLSFFSPCVLPLIPSTLVFLSGITIDDYAQFKTSGHRKLMALHTSFFVLGFSMVFVALGLSSSLMGQFLSAHHLFIMRIGGIVLILMGLFTLNVIKIPFLNQEKGVHLKEKPLGIFGSFVVGMTFSLGWTPCIGPALSAILIIASTEQNVWQGGYLLSMYSLGLAIPFILSAILFHLLIDFLKRFGHIVRYTVKILGALLIITGLFLLTGYFSTLSRWIEQLFALL